MKHSPKEPSWKGLKNASKTFALVVLALLTFSAKAGRDSYEIYLNNKLILKQYVAEPLSIKSLQLDKLNSGDKLVIFYSHCGQTGKGRSIAIKDDAGKIVKEWKFANASVPKSGMVIPARELMEIAKNKSHLTLFYAAQELPKGQMLASLTLRKGNVTYIHLKEKTDREFIADFVGISGMRKFDGLLLWPPNKRV